MERTTVFFTKPKNDTFFGFQRKHVRNRLRHEDEEHVAIVLLGPTRTQKQDAH